MRKKLHLGFILFLVFTTILCVFETLAYKKGDIFSITASRIWIIWTIYFVVCSLLIITKTLWKDIKAKNLWGISALLVVTVLVSIKLSSFPLNISGESTQQMASALQNIKIKDLNYTRTAFLGYPSRQYLLAAWPSVLFGRSIVSYRTGYLSIFILGIYVFYAGIRNFYALRSKNRIWTGLGILAILAFPIIPLLLRIFEQISIPLSLSLLSIGWFLMTIKSPIFRNILAFLWSFTMLTTSYTPSLAPWALLNFMLVILAFKMLLKKRWSYLFALILCLVTSVVFIINSVNHREDIRIPTLKSSSQMGTKIPETFTYFLDKDLAIYDNQISFLGKLMFLPTLVYLSGGLLYLWGGSHFILAIWIITTIIFSGISPGYSNNPVSFSIQKGIIIIPFLIWGMTDVICSRRIKIKSKYGFLLFLIFISYDTLNVYSIYRQSSKVYDTRSIVLRETLKTTKSFSMSAEDPIQLGMFTQYPPLQFFPDQLKYFYPKSKLLPTAECPKELSHIPSVIFVSKDNICYQSIMTMIGARKYTVSPIKYQQEDIKKSTNLKDLSDIQKLIVY